MTLISRTDELKEACAKLGRAPFIAVDTEFMREQTFWPKLCLVQIAADGTEVLIDSQAPALDLTPLFDLMVNEKVVKVFHSARQDIEIVHHLAGVIPHPIFDTQVAAMVCGFGEAVSYSMLVKRLLNRNLDKTSRFTDWSRRPLSERQLTYALGDVIYLRDLYPKLKAQLDQSERASWLNEEMAVLTDPATYELHPEQAWKRLKMRIKTPKALAVLMELAAWRARTYSRTRRCTTSPARRRAARTISARCAACITGLPAPAAAAPCLRPSRAGSSATLRPFRRSSAASRCRQRRKPWSICCACCSRRPPDATAWRRS
jgi:ribonuclease D